MHDVVVQSLDDHLAASIVRATNHHPVPWVNKQLVVAFGTLLSCRKKPPLLALLALLALSVLSSFQNYA